MTQSFVIDRKKIVVTFCGFIGAMFMALLFMHLIDKSYLYWINSYYFNTFGLFFITGGILYSSFAFPDFRSKERRYFYLMLPVTPFSKYIFEFLVRIVLFIIVTPIVFWIVANIEGAIIHYFDPDFKNYKFSFTLGLKKAGFLKMKSRELMMVISGLLLLFTIPFAGATFFRKNPTLKILLSVAIIIVFFIIYSTVLFKIFDLRNYEPEQFFKKSKTIEIFFFVLFSITNIIALVIGYFNVKEKEV